MDLRNLTMEDVVKVCEFPTSGCCSGEQIIEHEPNTEKEIRLSGFGKGSTKHQYESLKQDIKTLQQTIDTTLTRIEELLEITQEFKKDSNPL